MTPNNDTIEASLATGLELRSSYKLGLCFLTRGNRTIKLDRTELDEVLRWGNGVLDAWSPGRDAGPALKGEAGCYRVNVPDVVAMQAQIEAVGGDTDAAVASAPSPSDDPYADELPHLTKELRRKLGTINYVGPKRLITDEDNQLLEAGLIGKRYGRYRATDKGKKVLEVRT